MQVIWCDDIRVWARLLSEKTQLMNATFVSCLWNLHLRSHDPALCQRTGRFNAGNFSSTFYLFIFARCSFPEVRIHEPTLCFAAHRSLTFKWMVKKKTFYKSCLTPRISCICVNTKAISQLPNSPDLHRSTLDCKSKADLPEHNLPKTLKTSVIHR